MNFTKDIMITSLDEMRGYSLVNGDYMFTLDELQDATISNAEERIDITGKNGRLLNSLKRNKSVTISGTNGVLNTSLMRMQVGDENYLDTEEKVIEWFDDGLTLDTFEDNTDGSTTHLRYPAYSATAGGENIKIFIKNADGTIKNELRQAETATLNVSFSLNVIAGTASVPKRYIIEFATGQFSDATQEVAASYRRKVTGTVVSNESGSFARKCILYIDATAEDKCGNEYHVQFHIPKADFNGNFDLALGGDQTVQTFEAMALPNACGTGETFWTYTVFGERADVLE